jgi:hypothetical protein
MAAAPDDDARRTLAELEAKLRELERELLRGHDPERVAADPFAAAEEPVAEQPARADLKDSEPEPEPATFDAGEWVVSDALQEVEAEPAAEEAPVSHYDGAPDSAPEPERAFEPAVEPEPAAVFEPEPAAVSEPEPAAVSEPQPEPEPVEEPAPVATLDPDALNVARGLLATLRSTIEDMGLTAERITTEAQAVADDHGRTLGRLARAAQAAARAEEAALQAGRLTATVVVEAGPFADAGAVAALRDALAAQPGTRDAYVRGVEDGRAVIEVHLAPPPA